MHSARSLCNKCISLAGTNVLRCSRENAKSLSNLERVTSSCIQKLIVLNNLNGKSCLLFFRCSRSRYFVVSPHCRYIALQHSKVIKHFTPWYSSCVNEASLAYFSLRMLHFGDLHLFTSIIRDMAKGSLLYNETTRGGRCGKAEFLGRPTHKILILYK